MHVFSRDIPQSVLYTSPDWSTDTLSATLLADLAFLSVAADVNGTDPEFAEHSPILHEFPAIIALFRTVCADKEVALWLEADLLPDAFPQCLSLLCARYNPPPMYVAPVDARSGDPGYHTSWLACAPVEEHLRQMIALRSMVAGQGIDFNKVLTMVAVVPRADFADVLTDLPQGRGLAWFMERNCLFAWTTNHFAELEMIGPRETVERIEAGLARLI